MENFRPMLIRNEVTEQQWRVIRVLHESGPLDATELADRASILAPSLTRIIKNLESRQFIRKQRDRADGRRTILEIMPAGTSLITSALPESAAIHAALEKQIGKARLNQLLDMLEQLKTLKSI